jgi:hypothetical protein
VAHLTKDALLEASDLVERDVELPALGGSVRVRSLPAAYSNQASSEALVMKTVGRDQIATVDTAKLEVLQALHGLVDPKLESVEEAEKFARQCGPSFKKVIETLDDISGVDKEALKNAEARFPGGGAGPNGSKLASSDASGEGAD